MGGLEDLGWVNDQGAFYSGNFSSFSIWFKDVHFIFQGIHFILNYWFIGFVAALHWKICWGNVF